MAKTPTADSTSGQPLRIDGGPTVFEGKTFEGSVPYPGQNNTTISGIVPSGFPLRDPSDTDEGFARRVVLFNVYRSQDIMQLRLSSYRSAQALYQDPTEYRKISQEDYTPDSNPVSYQEHASHNIIAPLIDIEVGEFGSKDFNVEVVALNPEAKARKEEMRRSMMIDQIVRKEAPGLQEFVQMGLPNSEKILADYQGDLERFMEKGYKDAYSELIQRMLSEWMKTPHPMTFRSWANQTYKLYAITDAANSLVTIDPNTGSIQCPFIHPLGFVPDVQQEDSHFRTGKYCLYFEYASVEDVMMRYPKMRREDIVALSRTTTTYYGLPVVRNQHTSGNSFDIMLVHCYWIYPEDYQEEVDVVVGSEMRGVESDLGPFPEAELEEVPITEKRTIKGRYDQLYYTVLAAGERVLEHGVAPNQVRSVNDGLRAHLPGISLIYDYVVSAAKPNRFIAMAYLQDQFINSFNKLMELAGRYKGTIVNVDIARVPNYPWEKDEFSSLKFYLQTLQSDGLSLTDSRSDQPDAFGPDRPIISLQNVDGNAEVIAQLQANCNLILQQLQYQMNFSPARLGAAGQYSTTGNILSQQQQSNYGTADRLFAFQEFLQQTLTRVANLLKQQAVSYYEASKTGSQEAAAWIESFEAKYGSHAVSLLDDMSLQDLGITVTSGADTRAQLDLMKQLSIQAVQQGTPPDILLAATKILRQSTMEGVENVIEELIARVNRQQRQQQEAELAQAQALEQQIQADPQLQMQLAQQAATQGQQVPAPQPPAGLS